jgi:hypothetical protein
MSTASRALACCCLAATATHRMTTLLAGDSWNGADIRRAATAEPIAPLPVAHHGAPDGRTRGPHLGGVRVKPLPVLDS